MQKLLQHTFSLSSLTSPSLFFSFSSLLATIDQSTTATKFTVFDTKGNQVANSLVPHQQISLHSGWLEHNPEEIFQNTQLAISHAIEKMKQKKLDVSEIKAVGITNQRETVVAWNKMTGKPYHNAIVWSDVRTTQICERRRKEADENINFYKKINGLPISTYFTAFKMQWLLENVPEIMKNYDQVAFGTMDSYLLYKLTHNHLTDSTNASRTFLLNLQTMDWEPSLLEKFKISRSSLPQIKASSDFFGEITSGPLKNIPIMSVLGDQHAASLGHGISNQGDVKHTYGTGSFAMANIGNSPLLDPNSTLLTTVLYHLKNEKPVYGLEGSIEAGGSTLNWARDRLALFSTFDEMNDLLSKTVENEGVYLIPALQGLLAPYWRADVKGGFVGLSGKAGKEHLVRAVVESICYRTKDVIDVMEKEANIKIGALKVDGGITVNNFINQFQADLLQKKIIKTLVKDSTCLGSAMIAGLGLGIFKNYSEIKENIKNEKEFNFNTQVRLKYEEMYKNWKKNINIALEKN